MNKYDKTMPLLFVVPGVGSLPNNNYSPLISMVRLLILHAFCARCFYQVKSTIGFMDVSQ